MPVQAQPQTQTLTYRCPHCATIVTVEPRAINSLLSCPSPACGKPFRVEVPVAKPVIPPAAAGPPDCQPSTQAISAPPTPAATPSYRVPEPAPPSDKEEELRTVHLSMFRRYPWRCLGYWLLVAAGIAGMISLLFYDRQWLALLSAAVAAFAALRLAVWWLRMSRTTLSITNKRATLTAGLFSRQTTDLELDQLADFHVHQTTLMRWLDVGDIAIVSTSPQQPQIVLMAVPHPTEVTDLLQAHIHARRKATGPAAGGPLEPGTVVSAAGPVQVA